MLKPEVPPLKRPSVIKAQALPSPLPFKNEVGYSTYPAIYLYNQPANRLNTTPAWQDFHIPIVIDKP